MSGELSPSLYVEIDDDESEDRDQERMIEERLRALNRD